MASADFTRCQVELRFAVARKIRSTKAAAYRLVDHIDAPDRLDRNLSPEGALDGSLWNVAGGEGMGIVPYGSGIEISRNPIGSGPFRFVSAEQDKEVVIQSNDNYWGEKPSIAHAIPGRARDNTRALELRKGSADIEINALPDDTALQREPGLQILRSARGRGWLTWPSICAIRY